MNSFRPNVSCLLLTLLAVFACSASLHAQDKQPPRKGIDAETVAAYARRGAVYGGWPKSDEDFKEDQKNAEEGLPGFRFTATFPTDKLPDVAVPFGLDLSGFGSKVTKEGLKAIASLKTLTRLNLARTVVTDLGLEELAALKNLTILDLSVLG